MNVSNSDGSNADKKSKEFEPMEFEDVSPPKVTRANEVYTECKRLAILAFFAIWGVLARKGLQNLTSYDGSYLGGIIWCNFGACVLIGMLNESQAAWADMAQPKGQLMLYVGGTTGFCGTFSSFSTMILDAFYKSANVDLGVPYDYPNPAYGIMECLSVFIAQMALSISGYTFGRHLIMHYDPPLPFGTVPLWETVIAIAGIACWIAAACLMAIPSGRSWTFAAVMSPIACWMRYYMSKWLNPKLQQFPLGTFSVNFIATICLAIIVILNRGETKSGSRVVHTILSCHILQGLDDGFCGTLSTVSTFVSELHSLRITKGYIYAFTSITVCFCLMIIILGSYTWTMGLVDPLCS